jgi:peptide/nickel transport system substrate-binding protein
MADQLKTNLGMNLVPTPTDFKVFYDPIMAGNYDLAFAGFGLTLDPDDYTVQHSSQIAPENNANGSNWGGYSNPDLDAAIDSERTNPRRPLPTHSRPRKANSP